MPSHTTTERDKYDAMWAVESYKVHSPGERYLDSFLAHARPPATVLDAGCGTGKAALALAAAGFTPTLYDITDEGLVPEARRFPFYNEVLWRYMGYQRFDYVYCCDVLEHIAPQYTMLVVTRLLDLARECVFLSVSNVQDNFGILVGETLHLTVQPFLWWRESLATIAEVIEAKDLLTSSIFVIRRSRD